MKVKIQKFLVGSQELFNMQHTENFILDFGIGITTKCYKAGDDFVTLHFGY